MKRRLKKSRKVKRMPTVIAMKKLFQLRRKRVKSSKKIRLRLRRKKKKRMKEIY
jgi:hypothetical protein